MILVDGLETLGMIQKIKYNLKWISRWQLGWFWTASFSMTILIEIADVAK